MQEPRTHLGISHELCGSCVSLEQGRSHIRLQTIESMAADGQGLVHGGFVFGMADYAAMLAVNDPNVVLGKADVRFTLPVAVGDILDAFARVLSEDGAKRRVEAEVKRGDETVFSGLFSCVVLKQHVLSR